MSNQTWLSERRVHLYLILILVVAAVARVVVAFYLGDSATSWPVHDQDSYDALAQRVLAGKGFTFDRAWYPWVPPNTPTSYFSGSMVLYLVAIYAVVGHHPLAARLVTAAIGTVTCYLMYRLGRRLAGVQVGLITAGIGAVYAYLVYYSATLMTETIFIAAILLALDTSFDLVTKSSWTRWLRLGVCLAIAVLFRMAVLPFAILLIVWIVLKSRERPPLRAVLVPFVVIVLAVAPWTARNYELYGRFMLLESQFGHVFWSGNYPGRDVNFDFENSAWVAPLPASVARLNEADKSYALLRLGIQNVIEDPGHFLLLSLNRLKVLFMFWPSPYSSTISNLARVLSFGVTLPFMLYGLALSFRSWRRYMIIYLFMILHISVYAASWALIRYRLPIDPLLIMFAALALVDIRSRAWSLWPGTGGGVEWHRPVVHAHAPNPIDGDQRLPEVGSAEIREERTWH